MKEIKHLIWSSDFDVEDYKDLFEEENVPEEKHYERALEENERYLEDTRVNLDIKLDGRILVIGDIGRWNGRFQGYKIIETRNIKEIFKAYSDGYCQWWSDGQDIRGKEAHHDNTNYYLYREIREDRDIDAFLDIIGSGEEYSRHKLSYYTKSIAPKVHDVYGW